MQYAIVDGVRTQPVAGLKGFCEGCNSDMIAKCGTEKVHHWAHKSAKDCDLWWEGETEWHREWKNLFPEAFREVVFRDQKTKEIHRADIHTSRGVTIEFQNSHISVTERNSRASFYPTLIWVVNAKGFDITPTCHIPDPTSPLLNDYIFEVDDNGFGQHLLFRRKYDPVKNPIGSSRIFGIDDTQIREVAKQLDFTNGKYRMFTWKYKRIVWLETSEPVFLDCGHDELYLLRLRHQAHTALRYIQVVKKAEFVKKYIS